VFGGSAQIAGLKCFLGALEFFDGFGRNAELAYWNKVVSMEGGRGCRCTWGSRFETQAKVFPRVGHGGAVCCPRITDRMTTWGELSMDVCRKRNQ
jgi:hypothetical protein